MDSYKQGDGTGLCGLYAVLNTVHYLYPELEEDALHHLHIYLARRGPNFLNAYTDGTELPGLRKWVRAAERWMKSQWPHLGFPHVDYPWTGRGAPATTQAWWEGVCTAIEPDRAVAILGFNQEPDDDEGHWTVATHSHADRFLHLFDSTSYESIDRRELAWPGEERAQVWRIDPRAMVVFLREEGAGLSRS